MQILMDATNTEQRADRLVEALARIDLENGFDRSTIRYDAVEMPLALAEGRCAYEWLLRLRPDAGDELRIAVRGHHLRRWEIPRNAFDRTRSGYHAWRTALYEFHAEAVANVMTATGYPPESMQYARRLLRKQDIKKDSDAQALEDAVSLAFLELRLEDFVAQVDEEQLLRAIRRTWHKMSSAGHDLALTMRLTAAGAAAVGRALAAGDARSADAVLN